MNNIIYSKVETYEDVDSETTIVVSTIDRGSSRSISISASSIKDPSALDSFFDKIDDHLVDLLIIFRNEGTEGL